MSGTSELLAELRDAGLCIAVDKERAELVVQGPKAALTAELRERVLAHKSAIMLAVEAQEYIAEQEAIGRALGIAPEMPGEYDHKATIAGGMPPLQAVLAQQEWLASIDWRYGLRCGLSGQQCRVCKGMPCRESTSWLKKGREP